MYRSGSLRTDAVTMKHCAARLKGRRIMSDTDLLDAAEALGDAFSRRSEEIEAARRIPPDVSAQMAEAGFFAMGVPADLGGRENVGSSRNRLSCTH